MNKNEITLCGRIGSTFKEGRSVNGNRYIAMAMEIDNKGEFRNVVHILCFKAPVIDYLKKMKVREGTPIIVFGGVGSWGDEIKGTQIVQNAVFARQIYVIKTQA